MKPVDKAAWWIEYVCRNGITGASPLKPITGIILIFFYRQLSESARPKFGFAMHNKICTPYC